MGMINLTSEPVTIQLENNERETIPPLGVEVNIEPKFLAHPPLANVGTIEVIEEEPEIYYDKDKKHEILNKIADSLAIYEADVALVPINVLRAMRRTSYAANVVAIDTSPDSAIRDSNGKLIAIKRLLGNAY